MEGKVAIVTGGAGGIGSAVCRAFAGEGVSVAVADMDSSRADEGISVASIRFLSSISPCAIWGAGSP